jgi:hypothetical protein
MTCPGVAIEIKLFSEECIKPDFLSLIYINFII